MPGATTTQPRSGKLANSQSGANKTRSSHYHSLHTSKLYLEATSAHELWPGSFMKWVSMAEQHQLEWSTQQLDSREVEMWWIAPHYLAVWWTILGSADTKFTLPTWMNTSYFKGWLDNGVGLFVRAPDPTGHIYETAARDFNGCSKQRLWFHQARRRSPLQECAPSSWQKPRQCIEHLVDFQSKTPDTTHNTQSELTLKKLF